jgi:hypothetical protein
MADQFYDELVYLKQHGLNVYFEDCVRSLLDGRRRSSPTNATKFDINVHLRDYFAQVKSETHIMGREFAFIYNTPYNRRAFLGQLWSKFEASIITPSTIKDIHVVMLSICPDFPYSLLETSTNYMDDVDLSSAIDYVACLRAFQLQFIYAEFIDECQPMFRSFSHRLTCHVPTADISVSQPDYNYRQILLESFEKLITMKTCLCPPIEILNDVLSMTDEHVNHQTFLIQLAKSIKLTRAIGKEPNTLKATRTIQQQRLTIESTVPIQNEAKPMLTSLSTSTARISSPSGSAPLLPPLSKQSTLRREKHIRQSSPARNLVQAHLSTKRVESSASTRRKLVDTVPSVIEQDLSESDSDIESRSSDTDT